MTFTFKPVWDIVKANLSTKYVKQVEFYTLDRWRVRE